MKNLELFTSSIWEDPNLVGLGSLCPTESRLECSATRSVTQVFESPPVAVHFVHVAWLHL